MKAKPHPEQGFRACLGILRLARSYGSARIEAACRRGNDIGATTYGSIASILKNGLDRAYAREPTPDDPADPARQHPRHRLLPLRAAARDGAIRRTKEESNAQTSNRGAPGRARPHRHGQGAGGAAHDSPTLPRSASRSASRCWSTARRPSATTSGSMTRLRFASLRQNAVIEDVDMKTPRGLDRALFQKLAAGEWIERHQNLLIIGKTGVGKSWIACALGHKACRDNRSVLYHRVPRLFDALALARGDGRIDRLLRSLARVELLILDDWGLSPLTAEQRRDLLEILEDRHGRGSTMVTSQLPVEHWHEIIGDPTIADAILDRLVHNAHRLILKGESLRKAAAKRQKLDAEPVE